MGTKEEVKELVWAGSRWMTGLILTLAVAELALCKAFASSRSTFWIKLVAGILAVTQAVRRRADSASEPSS